MLALFANFPGHLQLSVVVVDVHLRCSLAVIAVSQALCQGCAATLS